MLSKKVDNLANLRFSKTFDNVGRILTGLKFSFISFLPFLCMGVTSDNSKEERKLEDLIALFMLVHKKSTNISIFSLIILVRILIFCEALVLSNLKNFFDFPNVHFLEMKGFALAVFLNYKNARVIFIFQTVFENWILNVFGN